MAGTKVKVKVTQGKSTVSPHGTNFVYEAFTANQQTAVPAPPCSVAFTGLEFLWHYANYYAIAEGALSDNAV